MATLTSSGDCTTDPTLRSVSQNPAWNRHTSLDAGVGQFRPRGNWTHWAGPFRPSSFNSRYDDEKRVLFDSSSSSPPASPTALLASIPKRRRFVSAILFLLGLVVFGGIVWGGGGRRGAEHILEDFGLMSQRVSFCTEPYSEYGRMAADQNVPERNQWLPYDPTCAPPELMASLRRTTLASQRDSPEPLALPTSRLPPHSDPSLPLPWLQGRTVLLFGDHVERLHNRDFCNLSGGVFTTIALDHPLSPPRFENGIDEKVAPGNQTNFDESRPSVCYIAKYDFMVVTVFHYGLANRVEFERELLFRDQHFYPPVALSDRLSHVAIPLLSSLHRPHPDLIEFSSGFWDLRHFTALDEQHGADPFSELTTERLQWYSDRLSRSLSELEISFPSSPLLWRSLHHPPKFSNTPFSRVTALDHLSRQVIADRNRNRQRGTHLSFPPLVKQDRPNGSRRRRPVFRERETSRAPFLNLVKGRIGKNERVQDVPAIGRGKGRTSKIRIDEWGHLMLGQEHLMRDTVTAPLPGGFVWGDIMLFELRRAVLGA